jgi:sugar O-acyltransferase (sialic acid O-acetyltransferase NeuD family)
MKALIGAGGFAREIMFHMHQPLMKRFVDDDYFEKNDNNIYPLSEFNPQKYEVIVAIGDPVDRYNMVKKLPRETKYFTFIHPTAQILDPEVKIGVGSIVCANTIITTNVEIGDHAHLNLLTTVGHDVSIGDFFTTAPGAKISGNCKIGNRVYFGTNSSVRQKIDIVDDVTIGLNAGVVKDITKSGTYVGVPAKKIK